MEHLEELLLVKARNESQFLNRPGVTAVDVGYKYVDGKKTDELAIRIHVKKKTSKVPLAEMIPAQIEDYKTDVLEGDYELQVLRQSASMLTADTGNYNPLVGGISIGPCRVIGGFIYAGTLGVPVTDRATGKPMLLSNFHVMCVDTGWHPGDSICQPSLIDTGTCPRDTVSVIARASLGGSVDGAVAQQTQRSSIRNVVDVGQIDGVSAAYPGRSVRKRGRTTGLTFGAVDGVGGSVNLDYGDGIGQVTLNNQISIAPDTSHNASFSDHGDSGSVVVNSSNQVVGLLFAGAAGGLTWANPIQNALDTLQVDVWASFGAVFAHGDPGNGIGGYDLGSPADRAFAFDYDSSGKLDHIALYRPGRGTFWIVKRNGNDFGAVFSHGDPGNGIGGYDLGSPADRAFAFDYDSSGKLDHIALYRPGRGTFWIVKRSGNDFGAVFAHGDPGNGIGGYDLGSPADLAFAFDYDGSGKLDHIALYRPGRGAFWIVKRNGNDFVAVFAQGDNGNGIGGYDLRSPDDRAFAFDYDGSGKLDHIALYRPGRGAFWIVKRNGNDFVAVFAQGDNGNGIGGYDLRSPDDRAFAFDYDGSGKLDHIALYRRGHGTFWMLKNYGGNFGAVFAHGDPGNGIGGYDLGSPADQAFAFDYTGSGDLDHVAIYRPGHGTFWILQHNPPPSTTI